jgi:hypothetical protein
MITAQIAAEEAYKDLISGRAGVRTANFKLKQTLYQKEKNKINYKYLFYFLFIIILSPLFFIYENKYEIKGTVSVDGNLAKNCKLNFLDKSELYSVVSDNEGEFIIKLKKGFYRIYLDVPSKKYSSPETSPFAIKLSRNLENMRIYVPK